MNESGIAIIAMISFWGTIAFIGYLFFSTRNRERMALIEKGQDARIFMTPRRQGISLTLRIALFAIGVAAGILGGETLRALGMDEGVAFPAMIFMGAGLGLFAAYMMDEWKVRRNGGTDQDQDPNQRRTDT